jgi:hypothetical protein
MLRKKENFAQSILTLILAVTIVTAALNVTPSTVEAKEANFYNLVPSEVEGTYIGETFQVSVNVTVPGHGGHGMFGYAFKFFWDRTLINATGATAYRPAAWGSQWMDVGSGLIWDFNATHGRYDTATTALNPAPEVYGNFTLVTVDFEVIHQPIHPEPDGYCLLNLTDAALSGMAGYPIPIDVYPCEYTIEKIWRDITVESVVTSVSKKCVGGLVDIDVMVINNGEENETFWLATHYNGTLIENRSISEFVPKMVKTFKFAWNTSGVTPGNYTIGAVATTVPNEADTTDNALNATQMVWVKALPSGIPWLEVTPANVQAMLGSTFDVNVTIWGLTEDWNLTGWGFKLWYDTDVLDTANVIEGPFLKDSAGSAGTFFIAKYGDINLPPDSVITYEGAGLISAACVFKGMGTYPRGNGTLATITFNATTTGSSGLGLYHPESEYRAMLTGSVIPCDAVNGYVQVVEDTTPPDITIISPENKTYGVTNVWLNFTVDEPTSWVGYSLDGADNATVTGNKLLINLTDGSHHVTVYANDTLGNMGASDTVYFSVDTTAPNITDVSQSPDEVLPTHTVQINATVTDAVSGVKQVTLNYTNGNGTWIPVDMSNVAGDVWNGVIPAFPYCTNVTYIIMAEDNVGNTITTEEMELEYQYHVVPEFPALLMLLSLVLLSLFAVFLVKKPRAKIRCNS